MKLFFASDIHGDADCCRKMLDFYHESGAEQLILLGDLLYHGPRNGIPAGYDPKSVIELLNAEKDHVLAVRGNCDAEIDQMVLEFPIMSDSMMIFERGRLFYLTHGHVYNMEKMPPCPEGTILIHGHTHVQTVTPFDGKIYINPGSVSLPKEGNPKTCMIYEDGCFRILSLEDGSEVNSFSF